MTEKRDITMQRAGISMAPHTMRALFTLLGAGAAGVLIWTATQVNDHTSGGYWAVYGLIAGAGLVFALAQRAGQGGLPAAPLAGFLLAFVPILIVVAWIAAAGDPGSNWLHRHVWSWSGDLGIRGGIKDLLEYLAALSFGAGVVLGTTIGPAAWKARAAERAEATPATTTLPPSREGRIRRHAPLPRLRQRRTARSPR